MNLLQNGFWNQTNQQQAFQLFLESAEELNKEGCWRVSVCYLFGYGVQQVSI